MLDALMLFPKSIDPAALDHVGATLVPFIKQSSGLRSLRVNDGDIMSRGGPPPYAMVIEASFGSLADWMSLVDALKQRKDFAEIDRTPPLIMFFEVREP